MHGRATIRIDRSSWVDRARLRCPRGHAWWEAHERSWYCGSCGRSYDELRDGKTGRSVTPADVVFVDGRR